MSLLWILGLIPLILVTLIIHEHGAVAVLGIAISVGVLGAGVMIVRQNWAAITGTNWLTPALIIGALVYGASRLRNLTTNHIPVAVGALLLLALST